MMRLARKQQGMSKLDAQSWVYSELDRLYPPPDPSPDKTPGEGIDQAVPRDSGQIRGLSDLPGEWPNFRRMLPCPRKWAGCKRTGCGL